MKNLLRKAFLPIIGFLSLIWFLIRVIPKPSRITYPCMKATAPVASTFLLYIIGLLSSIFAFNKAKRFLKQSRYVLFAIALIVSAVLGLSTLLHTDKKAYAVIQSPIDGANQPIGQGVGINPGRVVWIHNPDATDENCRNRRNDYWSQDDNTNQDVVNTMVSDALQMLTSTDSDAAAWDALFRDFNISHGKGDVGYSADEKIVIKINLNSNGCNYNSDNYERWNYRNVDTSPQIVYAVLDQLVNKAGVPQENIGFGDPGRNVDDIYWDKFHAEFPDVQYWGKSNGRTPIERSSTRMIYTSDGSMSDYLPACYVEAAYMINLPVFKKHHRAGISLSSKNHFGSFVPFHGGASHWHFSLPASEGHGDVNHGNYGDYRCFVDIMGHEHLGGKTILYLIDGLWSSTNWGHPPIKWRMTPFNNDWPSSIFMSQDPVAIESVGYDFLFEEFDEDHPSEGENDGGDNCGPFPHYAGTDDFLRQAADSNNRPAGITYDPENDGTPLPASLGVYEHWNNPVDKQYSRNLGKDFGIELVSNLTTSVYNEPVASIADEFQLSSNYPNPFNPTTTIAYTVPQTSEVSLIVYNMLGQPVRTLINGQLSSGRYEQQWDGRDESGRAVPSGVYFYDLSARNGSEAFHQSKKMVLSR